MERENSKLANTRPSINLSAIKAFRLVFGTSALGTTSLCVLTVVRGLIPAANLWVAKLIIDSVVTGIGFGQEAFVKTLYYILLLAGIELFSGIISLFNNVTKTLLGEKISHKISTMIIEKATSLDLCVYENPEFYDQLSRARQEASHRPVTIVVQVYQLIENIVTISSMLYIVMRLSWVVLGVLVFASVPYLFIQTKYAQKSYSLRYDQTAKSREQSYLLYILTSLTHFKEIKLLNIGDYLLDRYKKIFQRIYQENRGLLIKRNLAAFISSTLSTASYLGVYAYTISMTINKEISLGDLTLYSGAFAQSQAYLKAIISTIATLYEQNLFIWNLFSFLDSKPTIASPGCAVSINTSVRWGIEFKNVCFSYPGTDRPILTDLNFTIRANESIAIVGENGAGKSTIVKLITRLYDPSAGEILLDGVAISDFDPVSYQEKIGIVFQDYSQYNLSARENIGIGFLKEIHNLEAIKSAATSSDVHKAIENLPEGYESKLGKLFKGGQQLSVGEWQKLALARAFMRDSRILILDEPTASLDAKTEQAIFNRFKDLTKNKMSVLISHRFSTVRMVDRIFVLDGGRIAEQGSHDNLMRLDGKYAKMFKIQAERYGQSAHC